MRTPLSISFSFPFSLLILGLAAPLAQASTVYGFQGTYQDTRISLAITVEHASWLKKGGGGSSSRMRLDFKTLDSTVSGAVATLQGSSRDLRAVAPGSSASSAEFDLQSVKEPYLLDLHYQAKTASGTVMRYQYRLKLVQGRVRPGGMDKLTITVMPGGKGGTATSQDGSTQGPKSSSPRKPGGCGCQGAHPHHLPFTGGAVLVMGVLFLVWRLKA